jgi:hypothetical protein
VTRADRRVIISRPFCSEGKPAFLTPAGAPSDTSGNKKS